MPPLLPYDVAVIGAGPAGSAAARLLAGWGHSVLLADRGGAGRKALAESLPPSCIGLFETVGVREVVAGAGFVEATGNTAWWGEGEMRVERFAGGRVGYQVERTALDAVLRGAAAAAGAELCVPGNVLGVQLRPDEWHEVTVEVADGRRVVGARWVLDCTGRARLLARRGGAERGAPRTLALAGVWERAAGWEVPDDSHTLVESVEHGWGWSVPVGGGRRFFTVMLDPARSHVTRGGDLGRQYREELARLPVLGRLAGSGTQAGDAWACDATPYRTEPVAGDRVLCVGDAASFIDPLSSFGVKKALASGWLAAVVAHTALATPAMTAPAIALFAARERDYADAAERELATLARDAAGEGAAFWAARATRAMHDADTGDGGDERLDARIPAAFAQLKAREAVELRLADDVRVASHPMVRGSAVVLEPHLVAAAYPGGVRFVRNVDLLALVRIATRERDVGVMYERYVAREGRVALPDFLAALSTLVGRGLLRLA